MKHLKLLFSTLLLTTQLQAQWVQCDTMSIKLITDSIKFKDDVFSAADSVITLPFINNTSANFAYPQAKLINTTPLPTGMTLHDLNWQVFASAWNIGDTATASIGYDVNMPIPDNYTVTFKVYCKNFAPLAYDSCEFVNTITVNLKPVGGVGVANVKGEGAFNVYPNPATNIVYIDGCAPGSVMEVYTITGVSAIISTIDGNTGFIDVSQLPDGIYFIRKMGSGAVYKFVKQ